MFMNISLLKNQEKYANTISFYSTLFGSISVGLGFLLLFNNQFVNMTLLTCVLVTIAARVLEKKTAWFANISKFIYMIVFSVAPFASFYLLETAGAFGVPSIAYCFTYIFIANMYYNSKIVWLYSGTTILIYTLAILIFPKQFFEGPGKSPIAWVTFGTAFLISGLVSVILSKRSKKMILDIENQKNESEKLTQLLNQSINDAFVNSENLYNVAKNLTEAISGFNESSEQTMSSIINIAKSTSLQHDLTVKSYDHVSSISNKLMNISESISTVSGYAKDCSNLTSEGNQIISSAIEQIELINTNAVRLTNAINLLAEKSAEIGQITAMISSIAQQTNMLSVNASIEAAKAGEVGKGFSVVASEIRSLAEQSKNATEKINALIHQVQSEIEHTTSITNESNHSVSEGIDIIKSAGEIFGRIHASVSEISTYSNTVSESVQNIYSNSQDVVLSISDIKQASEEISQFSTRVAAASEHQNARLGDIHSIAEKLYHMSSQLKDSMNLSSSKQLN